MKKSFKKLYDSPHYLSLPTLITWSGFLYSWGAISDLYIAGNNAPRYLLILFISCAAIMSISLISITVIGLVHLAKKNWRKAGIILIAHMGIITILMTVIYMLCYFWGICPTVEELEMYQTQSSNVLI